MNFIQTLLAFLLALGPLIIFHELGHYWVARLCGVKVLRFSVGMGKVVWSRRVGPDQTEWAVSMLPLGGYVKMLDSRDPDAPAISDADKAREFTSQNVWRRIAIIAAGPVANFVLAIVVLAGVFMHGVDEPGTKVRAPAENSQAYQAGLRAGDRIVTVNASPVASWSELGWSVIRAAMDKNGAHLGVAREGDGVVNLELPARALAGLDLDADVLSNLGFGMSLPKPVLGKVAPDGPADRAGLQAGDLVLDVDGTPMADGIAFIEAIRASAGKEILVHVDRAGQSLTMVVTPLLETGAKYARIRAEVSLAPEMVTVQDDPLRALQKGAHKTWEMSAMTVRMIGKMIGGEASWKNVAGPIAIADYAGQAARDGVLSFVRFIAFVSISLGVMNLLPIPVLDGGLLLYYSLEVLTGRPVPERIGEFWQRAGLGLLVLLMAFVIFNDVARLL